MYLKIIKTSSRRYAEYRTTRHIRNSCVRGKAFAGNGQLIAIFIFVRRSNWTPKFVCRSNQTPEFVRSFLNQLMGGPLIRGWSVVE